MSWTINESLNRFHPQALAWRQAGGRVHTYGPSLLLWRAGWYVNRGDVVISAAFANGPAAGLWSCYSVTKAGQLGASDLSQYVSETASANNGSAVLRAMNLYYVDSAAAAGGSGAQDSPLNDGTSSINSGRGCLVRRGSRISTPFTSMVGNSASATFSWVTWASTGPADDALGVPTTASNAFVSTGNGSLMFCDDLMSEPTGNNNGLGISAASGPIHRVYARRMQMSGPGSGTGDGVLVGQTSAATADANILHTIVLEDCTISGFGGYGIGAEGFRSEQQPTTRPSMIVYGGSISECCNGKTSWGIGVYPPYEAVTSGWTAEGGDIYSRTPTGASVKRVFWTRDNGTLMAWLTENTGTPTTPSAGEYGLSGGLLYVNLGSGIDPGAGSRKVWIHFGFADGVRVVGTTIGAISRFGGADGAALGADNGTANFEVLGADIEDCEGEGVIFHYSLGGHVVGSVIDSCTIGILNQGDAVNARNNLLVDSSGAGLSISDTTGGTLSATNNVVAGNGGAGAAVSGASTLAESYNDYYGNASAVSGQAISAQSLQVDPELAGDIATNPALAAAGLGGPVLRVGAGGYPTIAEYLMQGRDGVRFAFSSPSIGATQR